MVGLMVSSIPRVSACSACRWASDVLGCTAVVFYVLPGTWRVVMAGECSSGVGLQC